MWSGRGTDFRYEVCHVKLTVHTKQLNAGRRSARALEDLLERHRLPVRAMAVGPIGYGRSAQVHTATLLERRRLRAMPEGKAVRGSSARARSVPLFIGSVNEQLVTSSLEATYTSEVACGPVQEQVNWL